MLYYFFHIFFHITLTFQNAKFVLFYEDLIIIDLSHNTFWHALLIDVSGEKRELIRLFEVKVLTAKWNRYKGELQSVELVFVFKALESDQYSYQLMRRFPLWGSIRMYSFTSSPRAPETLLTSMSCLTSGFRRSLLILAASSTHAAATNFRFCLLRQPCSTSFSK